jgi:hypothetical protein
LPAKDLQKSTKTARQLSPFRPTRRLCSNSQERKRRQLDHGARNRARQLISLQVPAKATRTAIASVQTNAAHHVLTHRAVSDDSWPTVLGIVPVSELLNNDLQKSMKRQTTHSNPSFLTNQSRCSQNMSDDCQSTVQLPRSAGTNQKDNLTRKKVFFFFFLVSNTSVPCRLSVRTNSVVEIHERSVLRQFELCRDESEARGDEEREHRCGLSVECQTALHTKVLDDEHASSMMSIASNAGKRQLCSAKQISGGARLDDSQAHATQRSVDLVHVDNEVFLASAVSG